MYSISRVRSIQSSLSLVSIRCRSRHFATVSPDQEKANQNCLALVQQHDYDNFLIGSTLPTRFRAPFFAVRAFHIELALIKDQSRKNLLSGRMRFQFWRDIINQIFSGEDAASIATQTPVARALHLYSKEFNLPQRYFERALDAR